MCMVGPMGPAGINGAKPVRNHLIPPFRLPESGWAAAHAGFRAVRRALGEIIMTQVLTTARAETADAGEAAVDALVQRARAAMQAFEDADQARVDEAVTALAWRSEEHTSELQSLMRISYAVFCLKKKKH